MMEYHLTPSQENYLEHIFRLSKGGSVRMREIAAAAGVRLPSVSRAIARLTEAGLVRHPAYGSVEITAEGVRAAQSVVRRDACLAGLLEEVLQMNPDEAAAEVCRLEHVVGESVLARLEILVEHVRAPQSKAWHKGLKRKLEKNASRAGTKPAARVGTANPHVRPMRG